MVVSRDQIPSFVPKGQVRMLLLGTMASVSARSVSSRKADADAFFYHNPTNHFWKILQLVYEPLRAPKVFPSVAEKKRFLEKHGIAITNIIEEIRIPAQQAKDPSDQVIFEAYSKGNVRFQSAGRKLKVCLRETPMFFTCSSNPFVCKLLEGYFRENKIKGSPMENVHFLKTPTRCNLVERAIGWKLRMAIAGISTPPLKVPGDYLQKAESDLRQMI